MFQDLWFCIDSEILKQVQDDKGLFNSSLLTLNLNTPISLIPGIGYRYKDALNQRGIHKAKDLLFYFPFRYDDFSEIKKIKDLRLGEKVTIEATLKGIQKKESFRRRMVIIEGVVSDDSGSLKIVWFNQPYLLTALQTGKTYRFSGKVDFNGGMLVLGNPSFEKNDNPTVNTGSLLPIYHEDRLLTSRWLRGKIFPLLSLADKIPETLPQIILKKFSLLGLSESIKEVHFPSSAEKRDQSRRRLAFEELFLIQLYLSSQKLKWQANPAPEIPIKIDLIKKFLKKLPFKLTYAQRKAAWEIVQDLNKNYPMNRLLEGDVGSGKTVVSAIAALAVANEGFQTVFLAPTEILAIQHFKTLKKILADFFSKEEIGVFTRSKQETAKKKETKEALIKKIKQGKIKIISGTHAILQENIQFNNLGFVIIDEQHRFGVEQRSNLQKKIKEIGKSIPHLLSMSATPIPRTLALAVYSDLDLSILNELPMGRQKIITRIIPPVKRGDMYEFIRSEVKKGRQIFVICPLVEDKNTVTEEVYPFLTHDYTKLSEQEVKAAVKEQEILQTKVFPEFKVGLLHGRMKGKDKEKIMMDFKAKKTQILVSTSVVEVGVDIPNATVMLIEGAERFGLAQLHQFRGRVGRGKHQSYCFLLLSEGSIKANQRLNAIVKCEDGFALAEQDLKIRGPGEFIGTRQSGLPDLTMANLSDSELIKNAKEGAELIHSLGKDLGSFPILKKRLESFEKEFHGE